MIGLVFDAYVIFIAAAFIALLLERNY